MLYTYLIVTQFGVHVVKDESIWDAMAKLRDHLFAMHNLEHESDVRIIHGYDLEKKDDCTRLEELGYAR